MIYDPLFDLDRDGKIDDSEWAYMDSVLYPDRRTGTEEDDLEMELALSGIDIEDLEGMDEEELLEALDDAGLDIGDFDEF